MKRGILSVLLASAMLFCGCSRICSDSDGAAPPETGIIDEVPAGTSIDLHFSELSMDDFTFSGGSFVIENDLQTVWRGEITDEGTRRAIWDILCLQEQQKRLEGGGHSSNYPLILTHRETGEEIYIGYGMHYRNDGEEGGVTSFIVSGAYSGTCCYAEHSLETARQFQSLIDGAVRQDEYIMYQMPQETDGAYAVTALVLANVHSNWAEGFQYYGEAIDLAGNVFRFDFSDDSDQRISWEEAGRMLWEGYEECALEQTGSVDAETMEKCWQLGAAVNPDAPMSETHMEWDAGQWTLCVFDSETGALIQLYSTGDYDRQLEDDAAKEILALYRSMYE